jgi:hypothetical protein
LSTRPQPSLARALAGTKAYLPVKAVHHFRGLQPGTHAAKVATQEAGHLSGGNSEEAS